MYNILKRMQNIFIRQVCSYFLAYLYVFIFKKKMNEMLTNSKKRAPELQLESCLFTAESWNRGTDRGQFKRVLDEALQDSYFITTQFLINLFTSFYTESIQQ